MKATLMVLALLVATSVQAQTANDDTTSTENWWDKVGGEFFSEATMATPRPEFEIRAQWTGLSADDQAAVRARCAAFKGKEPPSAPSLQEGGADNAPTAPTDRTDETTDDAASASLDDSTTTGSTAGAEVQSASPSPTPAPDTGLAGGQGSDGLVMICDLIADL